MVKISRNSRTCYVFEFICTSILQLKRFKIRLILSGLHNCKDFNEYKACSHDESTAFISICKSQTDVLRPVWHDHFLVKHDTLESNNSKPYKHLKVAFVV